MAYVAKEYVAGSPDAQVIGQIVISFSSNLRADLIEPVLPKYGLDNVDPEKWYPHQAWMDVLKEIGESDDAVSAFIAFGKEAVRNAVMPPELQTVPDVLNALHAIHHANLINVPEEEGYIVEKIGDGHYKVYQNTPNPDDAIYGFIWGLVARFKGANDNFIVEYTDNDKPDRARTCYDVRWGTDLE